MNRLFILGILCLFFSRNYGQEIPKSLQNKLETYLENQQGYFEPGFLETQVLDLMRNPIQINKANENDLEKLFFLNQNQIQTIVEHKRKYGPFISKYELQAIEGFSPELASLIANFISLSESKQSDYFKLWKMIQLSQKELIICSEIKLPMSRGYQDNDAYLGNPFHQSLRFRGNFQKRLYYGFGIEKDPGEPFGKMGDFQTFHLMYQGNKLIKTLAFGDYHLNLGMGLNMGTSGFGAKSSMVLQSQINRDGILPYRSLGENGFLRGIAVGIEKNKLHSDFWLSASPLTAQIQYDSLMQEDFLSAINASGYHRTSLEISRKNSGLQWSSGFHTKYQTKRLKLGSIFCLNQTGSSSNLTATNLVQTAQKQIGFYGNYQLKNTSLGGEISKPFQGKTAYLFNISLPLNSKTDWIFIYRNYPAIYNNPYSKAWSTYGSIGNEIGYYTAFVFTPKRKIKYSFYLDIFQSKNPRYQISFPSQGYELFADYNLSLSKTSQLYLRGVFTHKEKDFSKEISSIKKLGTEEKYQFRIQYQLGISDQSTYRFRAEKIWVKKTDNTWVSGHMMYHDFSWHQLKKKYSFHGRIQLFNVSDYLARIYVLEGDILYNYSSYQMQNTGIRFYLMGNYRITKNLVLDWRFSQTYLPESTTIGSGLDQINSNHFEEYKIQLRYKF
jgi:hypothetical protein